MIERDDGDVKQYSDFGHCVMEYEIDARNKEEVLESKIKWMM